MRPTRLQTIFMLCLALLLLPASSAAAAKFKILHGFGKGEDGAGVFAGVALDERGNVYGGTSGGGSYGYGISFELMAGPGGEWSETILHSFCKDFPHCSDGTSVLDTPALNAKGALYDISSAGIFQMRPGAHHWSFKVIYDGQGGREALPLYNEPGIDDLLLDHAGDIYGPFGIGKNYNGAVGELSGGPHGWKEEDLYDFCLHPRNGECPDGAYPAYRLTWDASGDLYGITIEGGSNQAGVVFQLEHVGGKWKEHVLYNFVDGRPLAGVVLDAAGNVYGSTSQGGKYQDGDVFMLSPQPDGTWKYTELYDFPDYMKNGAGPIGQMVFDQFGNLYGATSGGGKYGFGTVFQLTPGANGKWKHRLLHAFNGYDGEIPYAGLAIDSQGNLYGTTSEGGPNSYGVVYEVTP